MAIIPPLRGMHSTAPHSTVFQAIAPPVLPTFPLPMPVIRSATEAGQLTTAHSIDG